MDIKLYTIDDPPNKIGKNLTDPLTIKIQPGKDFDFREPPLMLRQPDGTKQLDQYNYLYIPAFERYYFIVNPVRVNAHVWNLECRLDVLETYKGDILNSYARFYRQIQTGDKMSASVEQYANETIAVIESDAGFDPEQRNLILTTVTVAEE